jgi:hypothetical protein
MGFRFRRAIKILPGLRLNFGKRGVSTSIGVRGAHITVGHGQIRETVGLPGSGLSYTHVEKTQQEAPSEPLAARRSSVSIWLFVLVALAVIAQIIWFALANGK